MDKVAIVTHTDADGVVSAAVAIYCTEPRQYVVLFTEPRDLPKAIRRLSHHSVDRIIICDIGMNSSTYTEVLELLKNLRKRDVDILWFDHHIWDAVWVRELQNYCKLVIDRGTCASEIVFRNLCRCGVAREVHELVRATCSVDLWKFDNPYAPWIQRFVLMHKRDLDYVLHKVLSLLKSSKVIDEEIILAVEKSMDLELKYLPSALQKVREISIGGLKIGFVVKTNPRVSTSILGHLMLSRLGLDVAVIVNPDYCSASLRSREFDIQKLAKELGGGGHPRASGFPLDKVLCFLLKIGITEIPLRIIMRKVMNKLLSMGRFCH